MLSILAAVLNVILLLYFSNKLFMNWNTLYILRSIKEGFHPSIFKDRHFKAKSPPVGSAQTVEENGQFLYLAPFPYSDPIVCGPSL